MSGFSEARTDQRDREDREHPQVVILLIYRKESYEISSLSCLISQYLRLYQFLYVYLLLALRRDGVCLIRQELLCRIEADAHKLVGLARFKPFLILVLVFDFVHPFLGQRLAEVVVLTGKINEFILGRKDQSRGVYFLLCARQADTALQAPSIPYLLYIQELIEGLLHSRSQKFTHI